MTMRTKQDRQGTIVLERMRTLWGETGDSGDHAVRVKDLGGLNNALAGTSKSLSAVGGKAKTLADTLTEVGNLVSANTTDVADLKARMSAVESEVAALNGKMAAAAAVSVPTLTVANVTAAPTKDDFNKAVADLMALRAALAGVTNALG